jgi:hypothetical protein
MAAIVSDHVALFAEIKLKELFRIIDFALAKEIRGTHNFGLNSKEDLICTTAASLTILVWDQIGATVETRPQSLWKRFEQ